MSLHPLCVLRYSATHREKLNLLYRLTPVDAYQMGLVKQISVSSNQVTGGYNQPYVKLLSVSNEKGFRARIELDVRGKAGAVSRKGVTVKPGADLFLLSGERELYEGYTVAGIDCTPGVEHIEFGNTEEVALGKAIGDVDEDLVKRAQIHRTIEAHLDKELRYSDLGIKVLSLFFMANESFAEFAETLQKEIEDDTGVKFGVLQYSLFAGMVYEDKYEEEKTRLIRQSALTTRTGRFISQRTVRKSCTSSSRQKAPKARICSVPTSPKRYVAGENTLRRWKTGRSCVLRRTGWN